MTRETTLATVVKVAVLTTFVGCIICKLAPLFTSIEAFAANF